MERIVHAFKGKRQELKTNLLRFVHPDDAFTVELPSARLAGGHVSELAVLLYKYCLNKTQQLTWY